MTEDITANVNEDNGGTMPKCSKCARPSIVSQEYSGMSLCREHFLKDFEGRAKKAIRGHKWLSAKDQIGIIVDRSSPAALMASAALIHFLNITFGNRPDLKLYVIDPDILNPDPEILSSLTKFALPKTLDDEAFFVYNSILNGNPDSLFKREKCKDFESEFEDLFKRLCESGAKSCAESGAESVYLNLSDKLKELTVMRPFLNLPLSEAELYAEQFLKSNDLDQILAQGAISNETDKSRDLKFRKKLLDDYAKDHPSAKYALVNLAGDFSAAVNTDTFN